MQGAPASGDRRRLPLPGLLFGLLALAIVHGPLLDAPPLFDEAPFLAGFSASRGAVLGMKWLPVELELLGTQPVPHRVFALGLEVALLLAIAATPLARASAAPSLLLVALSAYLVHPWRTESFVRLGARAVLVSEVLAIAGLLLALSARRLPALAVGLVLLAAAASGLPALAAAAIPLLWVASGASARRAAAIAVALLAGAAMWWIAAPPAAPAGAALAGIDLLARPWRTGLVHFAGEATWVASGAGLLVALLGLARLGRDAVAGAAVVAAALAFAAAPALRPPRTGLELIGTGLTPEAWLVPLALVLFAAWRVARRGAAASLPLLALALLAAGSGAVHARRFDGEAALLDHSIASEPRSVEARVARAQLALQEAAYAPPDRRRDVAGTAWETAQLALRRRPDDVAARALEALALALMGRLDEARAASDRLLESHPTDWRARACRAELESLAGDDLTALRWLRAAVDAQPTPFLRSRESLLLDRIYDEIRTDLADRRFESARRRCERLLALAPEEVEARLAIVASYERAGDLPRAFEEAKRLYAERPHDRRAVQVLASFHERLGDRAAADELKRRLLALPEPEPRAR